MPVNKAHTDYENSLTKGGRVKTAGQGSSVSLLTRLDVGGFNSDYGLWDQVT